MNKKANIVYLIVALLSWFLLASLNLYEQFWSTQGVSVAMPFYLKGLILNAFLFGTYLYITRVNKISFINNDFYGLIWRAFAISLVCGLASASLSIMIYLLKDSALVEHPLLYSIFYQIDFGLLVVFLLNVFVKWKQLISHNSSKTTKKLGKIFEFALVGSLLFHFVHFDINLTFYVSFGFIGILGLYLSFKLNWIPYLTYKQKLIALLLLLGILGIQVYFLVEILEYIEFGVLSIYTVRSTFFFVIYSFTAFYCFVTVLALFFNLPTSSVFDKKINELAGYHELSRSILTGDNERHVCKELLDSSLQTVKADAAWIELHDKEHKLICNNIKEKEVAELQELIKQSDYKNKRPRRYSSKYLSSKSTKKIPYDSILCMPLLANNTNLGTLVLLKNIDNAFDNILISSLSTFIKQAGLVIYNFRLVGDAIANQRYKEELKIAHRVQESLLPDLEHITETFQLLVTSGSADKVGGDYYDYYKISDTKHAFIIADVSGKGTSAAFNMAQMKGVFHSLVRFDLSPDLFFEYANNALSGCLERKSFITASYFVLDTEHKKCYFSRAGHCPTLYHSTANDNTFYFENQGLGLGIMRNKSYANYIKVQTFDYQKGDLMLLYTDGIVEARNEISHEEYGYERLETFLNVHHNLPLEEISDKLIEDINKLTGSQSLDDDYTIMLVRF
jgi:hypothetical protein